MTNDPDVIGSLVYRNGRLANAPAVVIGDLRPYLVAGPSYTDAPLPDGAHCYRIVAMDEAGNTHDKLPFGYVFIGPWTFHPLVLLFLASGSAMISGRLRVPKP